ncbi:MAG: hypothetical protein KDD39_03850 [Bdellovibrionales bacterium]|nr:hypothetical protein [Bdellovibrionales bacterium]
MSAGDTLWSVDVYAVEDDGNTTYIKSIYFKGRAAATARAIAVNSQPGLAAVLGSSKVDLSEAKLEFADAKPSKQD